MNRAPTAEAGPTAGSMSGVITDAAPREGAPGAVDQRPGRRLSVPLVPTLSVLLVLVLAAVAYLFLTRPDGSSIRVDDYTEALQAARSNVVDLTSFDHLTLDDDIEQARRVTTGDLREESVAELDGQRQAITEGEVVVSTEVIGAGVTRVTDDRASVLLVIQATQSSEGSEQSQVSRYRIEADLVRQGDRWLLSGIQGR
jgi:Mce-associated membrane protein